MNLTERTGRALAWIDSQIAICRVATSPPWQSSNHTLTGDKNEVQVGEVWNANNMRFIAAARTGYPEMLDGMKVAIAGITAYAGWLNNTATLETILARIEALQ